MEAKEIKITPPAGYEIDKENSTFECIKFKKKSLTYEDVAKELFELGTSYYIVSTGKIVKAIDNCYYAHPNTAASEKQLEKLITINILMNVAKYLNGAWKPDWNSCNENKYSLYIGKGEIYTTANQTVNEGKVYFKSAALAQQAVDILGEDTIRLALSTDW